MIISKKYRLAVGKYGIDFSYYGDDVEYIWPWKRTKRENKWISFGFDNSFRSLKEIKKYWDDMDFYILTHPKINEEK